MKIYTLNVLIENTTVTIHFLQTFLTKIKGLEYICQQISKVVFADRFADRSLKKCQKTGGKCQKLSKFGQNDQHLSNIIKRHQNTVCRK